MHILISVLIGAAALIFWLSRAARGASDLADSANELANLPRRLRYRRKAGKRGLDLIEDPVDAAAILMISIARMDGTGRVENNQAMAIAKELRKNMQLNFSDAQDIVLQMRTVTNYLVQPSSTLYPMVKILQDSIDRAEARELSDMLGRIAEISSPKNADQTDFIHRYEERMGLLN